MQRRSLVANAGDDEGCLRGLVSIRWLSVLLSVSLVAVAGGLVGSLSIGVCDEAAEDVRNASLSGVASIRAATSRALDYVSDVGATAIDQCTRKSHDQIRELGLTGAAEALRQSVWFYSASAALTENTLRLLTSYVRAAPHDVVHEAAERRRVLSPLLRAAYHEGYKQGAITTLMLFIHSHDNDPVFLRVYSEDRVKPHSGVGNSTAVHYLATHVELQCAEHQTAASCPAECVWCAGANGVCVDPRSLPCPAGLSAPPGFVLPGYLRDPSAVGLGVPDARGNLYVGPCGWGDNECGCAALRRFQSNRTDGFAAEADITSTHYPGVCIADGSNPIMSTAGIISALRSDELPIDRMHWVPLDGLLPAPEHGLMAVEVVSLGDETAVVAVGSRADVLAQALATLGQVFNETQYYVVQVDTWREGETCRDDPYDLLSFIRTSCAAVVRTPATDCSKRLNDLIALGAQSHLSVETHCPATCGVCEGGRFPIRNRVGLLLETSRGPAAISVDRNASQFGGAGVHDLLPLHVLDSPDPLVRANAEYVFGLPNAYESIPEYQFRVWMPYANSTEKWWMVRAKATQTPIDGGTRMESCIVMMIAEEQIVAEVDRLHAQLQLQTSGQIATTRETVDELVNAVEADVLRAIMDAEDTRDDLYHLMYVVASLTCAVLMGLGVLFVLLITRPLSTLAQDLHRVAVMDLERVRCRSDSLSALAEVRRMQMSFGGLVTNLTLYRSFMPQSVLVEVDMEESIGSACDMQRVTSVLSSASKPGSDHGMAVSGGVSGMGPRTASDGLSKMRLAEEEGMKRRKVTLAVVSMTGWHAAVERHTSEPLVALHSAAIQLLHGCGTQCRGVADTFCGDRMLSSFNGVTFCTSHRVASVHYVAEAAAGLAELLGSSPVGVGVAVSAAATTGDLRVCNMGCSVMKRFTFLGPSFTFAWALERVNAACGTKALLDSSVYGEARTRYEGRLADVLLFRKLTPQPLLVHELLRANSIVPADEWMYEIQALERACDKYAAWNKFITSIADERWGEAAAVDLDEVRAGMPDVPECLVERFVQSLRACQFSPREVLLH